MKLPEPFTITFPTHNIEECSALIIEHLIKEHPFNKSAFYAEELGVSERTFLRYKRNNPQWKQFLNSHTLTLDKIIEELNRLGYEIVKKTEQ